MGEQGEGEWIREIGSDWESRGTRVCPCHSLALKDSLPSGTGLIQRAKEPALCTKRALHCGRRWPEHLPGLVVLPRLVRKKQNAGEVFLSFPSTGYSPGPTHSSHQTGSAARAKARQQGPGSQGPPESALHSGQDGRGNRQSGPARQGSYRIQSQGSRSCPHHTLLQKSDTLPTPCSESFAFRTAVAVAGSLEFQLCIMSST